MSTKITGAQAPAVRVFLDHEAADALDRARRRERQSRAAYMRTLLMRRLHEVGELPAGTTGAAR